MTDKAVDLLNKSFLMQWAGNYLRSEDLVYSAWDHLKEEEGFKGLKLVGSKQSKELAVFEKHLPAFAVEKADKGKKKQKKKMMKKKREDLILRQAQYLLDVAEKHWREGEFKDVSENASISDPITTGHSDEFSCLIIQSDLNKLEVRVVVNGNVLWEKKDIISIISGLDEIEIEIHQSNSHEVIIDVNDKWIFGTIHFSSMGIGESIFYERCGLINNKARMKAAEITKQLAMRVYGPQ